MRLIRLRTSAALLAMTVLLAGCTDGCEWVRESVGGPRAPAQATVGELVEFQLDGWGWTSGRGIGGDACPQRASVVGATYPAANAAKDVRSVVRDGACVVAPGERIAVRVPVAASGDRTVRFVLRIEAESRAAKGVTFLTDTSLSVPVVVPPGTPPAAPAPAVPAPVAAFTVSPARPSTGHPVTLTAERSDGNRVYLWDLDGNGAVSADEPTGPSVTTSFPQPGPRTVGLFVVGSENRRTSTTRTFDVREEAGPDAAFAVTPQSPVAGAPARFDASATTDPDGDAIATYRWDFGDGTVETTAAPVIDHTYAAAGPRTVTLEAVDTRGLTSAPATLGLTVVPARRGARAAAAAAAKRRPSAITGRFRLGLRGSLVSSGKVTTTGGRLRATGAIGSGTALASLPKKLAARAPAGLRRFRGARWAGRFDATFRGTAADVSKARGTGVVLIGSVTHRDTSVCLRVSGEVRSPRTLRFTVLGGTGPARRLVATGGGARDTITARTALRARGLPRACASLRRVLARVR